MKLVPRIISVASTVVALTGVALRAQPSTPPAEEVFVMPEFSVDSTRDYGYRATNTIVATGFSQEIYRTPLNITIATKDLMDDIGAQEFLDAAQYMSGITAAHTGTNGVRFQVRGFETAWTFRNGIQRYTTTGMDNVSRFEVVKGPAAVFFGRVAPGGMVNYATRRASMTPEQSISLALGSDDYFRAEVGSQGPLLGADREWLGYRINASYLDRDGARDFEFQEREFFFGGLVVEPVRDMQLFLEYEKLTDRNLFAQGLPFVQTEAATATRRAQGRLAPEATPRGYRWNGSGPDGYFDYDLEVLSAELQWKLTRNFSFRSLVINDHSNRQNLWIAGEIFNFNPATNTYTRGTSNTQGENFDNDAVQYQAELLTQFDTGPLAHRLLTGWMQFNDDYMLNERVKSLAGVFDYRGYAYPRLQIGDLNPVSGQDNTQEAFYGNYVLQMFDSRLNLMVGGRDEKFTQNVLNADGSIAQINRYKQFQPMAGFSAELVKGVVVFGSYSESYEPFGGDLLVVSGTPFSQLNQRDEIYPEYYTRNANGVIVRRADIPQIPREGEGWDVGLKFDILTDGGGRTLLSGATTLFETRRVGGRELDRARTAADPRNEGRTPETGFIRFFRAAGLEVTRGLEVDLVWTPTPEYQALLSYTYLHDAERWSDTYGSLRLATTPENSVSLWNKYTFTSGRVRGLSLGFGGRYVDGFLATNSDIEVPISSSVIFDAMVGYETKILGSETEFLINVTNLFDRDYIVGSNRPGQPLRLRFTVSTRF